MSIPEMTLRKGCDRCLRVSVHLVGRRSHPALGLGTTYILPIGRDGPDNIIHAKHCPKRYFMYEVDNYPCTPRAFRVRMG